MNINPFSYLIEKLKGKVNKSGDTMTGNLNIQTGGECYVKVKNTVKETETYLDVATTGEHGLWSSGYNDGTYHASGKWLINRQADGSTMINGNVEVPSQTGTLVLKSELPYMYQKTLNTFDGATSLTFEGCPKTYRVPALLIGNGNHAPYFAMIMYDSDGGNPNGFIITSLTGQTLSISATLVNEKWNITIGNLATWGNYKLIVFN